jgi:putative membrane protein (TIGR04086 family)
MTKFDAPEPLVSVMSSFSLCLGAYVGGYTAAKRRRQNGMIIGILTGIFIYCVIFFAGVIFAKNSISFSFLTKLIMTLICAAVGGVVGVNSKGKRY